MKKSSLLLLLFFVMTCVLFAACTPLSEIQQQSSIDDVVSSTDSDSSIIDNESSLPDSSIEPDSSSTPDDPVIDPDKQIRVLFFGNSLMFFNDMPSLFRNLTEKSGKNIYVDSVTRGSATISDFADSSTDVGSQAYPKLLNQNWDYVVIEPSRRITPYENTVYEAELNAAKRIQTLAKSAGAEILLYCVWGNDDGTLTQYDATNPIDMTKGAVHYDYTRKMHVEFLRKVSTEFSEELGGVGIIDAGYAFENSMVMYPAINLYDSDRRHPSLEGSYLAAACVYAKIYKQSPENIGFTGGTPLYFEMQRIARITQIDGVVPDLEDQPEEIVQVDNPYSYDVLVLGSGLMNDYDLTTPLNDMIRRTEMLGLNLNFVLETSGVFSRLANQNTDYGLRDALKRTKYDAVVMQISRRCTPSSPEVAENELKSLKAIYPLIKENCDNIYLFTLNGQSNPAIFEYIPGSADYNKTNYSENITVAKMNEYYNGLATEWAKEVGCKAILHGSAWTVCDPSTDMEKGYVRACAFYNAIFQKQVPAYQLNIGLDAEKARQIEKMVERYCLDSASPEIKPLPEYDTYDLLVIGSHYMSSYDVSPALSSFVSLGQGKELYVEHITSSVGVFNQLINADESDKFYNDTITALSERRWDAIVLQLSRRITPGSTVETSEIKAFDTLYPMLCENTDNIYLITLAGSENPAIFTVDGSREYAKTTYNVMATVSAMDEYFATVASQISALTNCGVILQGQAYTEANLEDNASKGYLRACCYYNVLFGERVPVNAQTGGVSESVAKDIRKIVSKYCLAQMPADLSALNAVIQIANQKTESDYTPASWQIFEVALQQAKTYGESSYQEDIDGAVIALQNAIDTLVQRANFTALNQAIQNALAKSENNYTANSWANFKVALQNAQAVDLNAEQAVVDAAEIALNDAMQALIIKADLTDLNNAIQTADQLDQSEYTVESWQVLQVALEDAKALTEFSPAQEVAAATVALTDAINKLVLKLARLNALLLEVGTLVANDYTTQTWESLQTAVNEGKGLTTANSDAEINAVVNRIEQAKIALVVIPVYDTYDILFIGSDLIKREDMTNSLASMVSLGQGKQLHLEYVTDGVGIFNRLVYREDENNNGDVYTLMRKALNERKWDAIILQLSRRCTPGSEVETSEYNALKAIYPLLTRNSTNIYLFTLDGSKDPEIYANIGISYKETSQTYTATAEEVSNYYKSTVESWGAELGAKTVLYGTAIVNFTPSTSNPKLFMRAVCIYYAIFGEEIPDGSEVLGTTSSGVKKIKDACAFILDK